MNVNNDIAVLFERFASGEAGKEEFVAFYEKVKESGDETLLSLMDAHFEKGRISENAVGIDWEEMFQKILSGRESGIIHKGDFNREENGIVRKGNFLRSAIIKWLSAAAVLLLIGAGAYIYINSDKPKNTVVTIQPSETNDIIPGTNKATLTLSDGKSIELNNAASETIKDGTLSIENNDGRLIYKNQDMVAVNTMSTPRGGQYQLTLSDGSKVWLNAASSITYPTSFTEKTREVTISGEAYFEVKSIKEKPFIVSVGSMLSPFEKGGRSGLNENADRRGIYQITVLGTSFNVNTYPDEPSSKTSLIEGSVKINNLILKPNEAYTNGKIISTSISQDLAWKNGVFDFNNVTVQQAMRQIARWYDVNIIYDKPVNEVFIGEVNRNLKLSQVLKVLDGLGVHFRLEGKNLHVFP